MSTAIKVLTLILLVLVVAITGFAGVMFYKSTLSPEARTGMPVLYDVPDFTLTDSQGEPFSKSALDGKVWVADFFFTSCPGPCPIMTAQMVRLAEAFKDNPDVQFVGFSVDPDTDTPERLRAYEERYGIDPARYHLLTGPIDKIQFLAESGFLLGSVDTPSQHSTRFSLVDRKGRTRAYFEGTDTEDVDRLREAIKKLL